MSDALQRIRAQMDKAIRRCRADADWLCFVYEDKVEKYARDRWGHLRVAGDETL